MEIRNEKLLLPETFKTLSECALCTMFQTQGRVKGSSWIVLQQQLQTDQSCKKIE